MCGRSCNYTTGDTLPYTALVGVIGSFGYPLRGHSMRFDRKVRMTDDRGSGSVRGDRGSGSVIVDRGVAM